MTLQCRGDMECWLQEKQYLYLLKKYQHIQTTNSYIIFKQKLKLTKSKFINTFVDLGFK